MKSKALNLLEDSIGQALQYSIGQALQYSIGRAFWKGRQSSGSNTNSWHMGLDTIKRFCTTEQTGRSYFKGQEKTFSVCTSDRINI